MIGAAMERPSGRFVKMHRVVVHLRMGDQPVWGKMQCLGDADKDIPV